MPLVTTRASVAYGAGFGKVLGAAAAVDAGAMFPIFATTVTSTAASITFSNIPTTYTHLQVRYISRTNLASASANLQVTFNSDTTSGNYSFHRLVGDGSSVSAYGQSGLDTIALSAGANSGTNIFGVGVMDIVDYKNTNKYKTTKILTGLIRNNTVDSYSMMRTQVWINTNAIASITFTPSSGSLVANSSFALYGIK